jgi:hypothetical protein
MSTTRRPDPDEVAPRSGQDPAVDALLDYLVATAVTPPTDLAARIQARVEGAPPPPPPRRNRLARLHLRLPTAAGAFRQLVHVTMGRGRFPALMRAQALSLVLITVLSAAALVAGAAIGVTQLVQDRRAPAVPIVVPDPDRTSTPSPDLETPRPTDADTDRVAEPTPRRSDRTPRPEATRRPSKTAAPVSDPDPTRRPARTPKPTERPTAEGTPRPERTPRRTERPEKTEHPEPTETPEADGDGDDDDGHTGPDVPDEDGDD